MTIIRATRRDVLRHGSAAAAAGVLPAPAIAQAWPSKPIRIVCGYPAGGLTDIFARAYGDHISQKDRTAGARREQGRRLAARSPPSRSRARRPTATR